MKGAIKIVTGLYALFILFIFSSCNNAGQSAEKKILQDTTALTQVKEDSIVTKLRPVLFDLENKELSFNGRKPFDLTISNIRYNFISLKEYYTNQQASLQAQAKHSTNKEKTDKALNYLEQMIKSSVTEPEIYKVQFHLKAQVDKNYYNDEKTLYLKKDLTLLQLIFPE